MVATSLDRQLQFSVEQTAFSPEHAMRAPDAAGAFDVLRAAVTRFNADRSRPFWQLAVDKNVRCPSTAYLMPLLKRLRCLIATMNFSIMKYLLRLKWAICSGWPHRSCAAKNGWSMSPAPVLPLSTDTRAERRYHPALLPSGDSSHGFTQQTERNNRARGAVVLSPHRQHGQRAHDHRQCTHLF